MHEGPSYTQKVALPSWETSNTESRLVGGLASRAQEERHHMEWQTPDREWKGWKGRGRGSGTFGSSWRGLEAQLGPAWSTGTHCGYDRLRPAGGMSKRHIAWIPKLTASRAIARPQRPLGGTEGEGKGRKLGALLCFRWNKAIVRNNDNMTQKSSCAGNWGDRIYKNWEIVWFIVYTESMKLPMPSEQITSVENIYCWMKNRVEEIVSLSLGHLQLIKWILCECVSPRANICPRL